MSEKRVNERLWRIVRDGAKVLLGMRGVRKTRRKS